MSTPTPPTSSTQPISVKPRQRQPGASPDSLVLVGERRVDQPLIQILDYCPDSFAEYETTLAEDCLTLEKSDSPTWIRVVGLHEPQLVRDVLRSYQIHPLIHQDVLNTTHPAKLDDYEDYIFITSRLLPTTAGETAQHFAMVLTNRVVITFQEAPSSQLDPVVQRLRDGRGRLRAHGPDYLAWALLDTIMDHYLLALGELEDRVAKFEGNLMDPKQADPDMQDLYQVRMDSLELYRILRPLREVIARLVRLDHPLLSPELTPFLRDLYDHSWHASELADHLRDSIAALREFHQSTLAQRMNEVMKVLAAISTLFLPLTFIAGIYGMNFDHQPELHWRHGYLAVWGVFVAVTLFMLWYFRRQKWL